MKTELILNVRVLEARSVVWCQPPASSPSQNITNNNREQQSNNENIPNGHATTSSSPTTIFMEVYAFGPFQTVSRNWPMKIIPAGYVDTVKRVVVYGDETGSAFEFKVSVGSSEAKRLCDSIAAGEFSSPRGNPNTNSVEDRKILESYEIELVMREIVATTGQTNVIGVAVFNLSEAIQSAHVWRRLIREEQMRADDPQHMYGMTNNNNTSGGNNGGFNAEQSARIKAIDLNSIGVYSNMDLWLPLRPRLKINDYGYKVLKVLDKHASDRRAIEFVKVKSLFRSSTNINTNHNNNNFY